MPNETSVDLDSDARHPALSKSRLLAGDQCSLRLWYDCFEHVLAAPPDAIQEFRFQQGTEVGRLAQERYPGGLLVSASHREPDLALVQTQQALADPAIPAIYEAAFRHRGVLVRVDVLVRRADDTWDLIEVKSGTKAKDVYIRDIAIQSWVARGAGLNLRRVGLLLLNRGYVFDGLLLDLDELFRFADMTAEATALAEEVGELARSLEAMLASSRQPDIAPGDHCHAPYECAYLAHCTKGIDQPEHPVTELPRIRAPKRLQLAALGIEEISAIPDDFPLSELHSRIRSCVARGESWSSATLSDELNDVTGPVYHLDFEAFMPAIPQFAGSRPYDATPFQYSIHVEADGGYLEHREYLHTSGGDPRRLLAERLISDLSTRGSICVYSNYEAKVIGQLVQQLPDLAAPLTSLLDRLWDLLPIIRRNYYHPDLHGSFSLKRVLPALVPGMSYEGLEINDGLLAAARYEETLAMEDAQEREQIFESLRTYCAQDTLAMVELRRALLGRAAASARGTHEGSRTLYSDD